MRSLLAAAGAAALLALAACTSSGAHHDTGRTSPPVAPVSTQYSNPTPAPVATQAAPPQFTPAQQQVIDSAESYLTDGQGFSKAGLFHQLTSSYGEGFSPRLARFALAHLRVNWNRQAVLSAKGYLQSGQGFSYSGLVQQLNSPYGEQFTLAQAQHGASVALRQGG